MGEGKRRLITPFEHLVIAAAFCTVEKLNLHFKNNYSFGVRIVNQKNNDELEVRVFSWRNMNGSEAVSSVAMVKDNKVTIGTGEAMNAIDEYFLTELRSQTWIPDYSIKENFAKQKAEGT